MSRLDFFTIVVVALCILAIVYLIFQATKLSQSITPDRDRVESNINDFESTDEDEVYDEDGLYDETSANTPEGGIMTDVAKATDAAGEALVETKDKAAGLLSDAADKTGDAIEEVATKADEVVDKITNRDRVNTRPAEDEEMQVIRSNDGKGQYLVIAGTFRIKAYGDEMTNKLRRMGYDAARTSIFDRGTYAVTLVDRFESRQAASELASELKGKGIEAYVQVASR